jgi:hypothetical protein
LPSGVIGGFGGVLESTPLTVSRRINACARPGCIPIIALLPSAFRAPRNPGCLETAYPTIQHVIGQTESTIAASTIVEPALNVAVSTIVEPKLNVAASTVFEPERPAAFSRHGDLPALVQGDPANSGRLSVGLVHHGLLVGMALRLPPAAQSSHMVWR